MSNVVIQLKNVSKTFYIRERSYDSIRKRVFGLFDRNNGMRKIEALKNVNLEIQKGEFIGIIGHNGSGKSTLLKIMIGALQGDRGSIVNTKGKIVRLALGMGFDPELSARDNIYLNGSIMGLTFRQIGEKFQEIIDFSGLNNFVETPLKFYSSGMVSRLAFAVAMHVEADILLIDEFFGGVGDQDFREKSDKVFRESVINEKTIVFVSHEIDIVKQYAHRIFKFSEGKIISLKNNFKLN
jgi:ABC-type polysaccharide/polyol phosphate transport system ATPase subunit